MKTMKTSIFTSLLMTIVPATMESIHGNEDCTAFTVGRCNFDSEELLSTTLQESDVFCNFLCEAAYAGRCRFYVYDFPNRRCDVYGSQQAVADSYSSYCELHAGPAKPSLSTCWNQQDGDCQVFLNT